MQVARKAYRDQVRKYMFRMREKPTPAELEFRRILDSKFPRIKYRFQATISIPRKYVVDHSDVFYIVDFVLHQFRLFIEIDGGYHNPLEQKGSDFIRQGTILMCKKYRGYRFLRFKNEEVLNHKEEVIKTLRDAIHDQSEGATA